jgi:hypothetical protein
VAVPVVVGSKVEAVVAEGLIVDVGVNVGALFGEGESGVKISVGAEVGVLNPVWEQASKNDARVAARPIVATSRKNSRRLNAGFLVGVLIFAS